MKNSLIGMILVAASSLSSAQTGLHMPGSTWAQFSAAPKYLRGNDNNMLFQGNIEQGIIVGTQGPWRINTYASLAFSTDKNGYSYNNKLVPTIGIKLQQQFQSGTLDIGVQAVRERYFRGVTDENMNHTEIQLYGQYWFGWDLHSVFLR
jgi:hypothetical protein